MADKSDWDIDSWKTEDRQADELAQLRAEVELLRMQLAGCGVAAMCNTEQSIGQQRIGKDNPYWSASYGDVCAAVDREMKLRAEVARLKAERDNWENSAAQFHRNECFYRDLLDEVAKHLGPEVFVSDDGSIQDSPLRLKIPELVSKLLPKKYICSSCQHSASVHFGGKCKECKCTNPQYSERDAAVVQGLELAITSARNWPLYEGNTIYEKAVRAIAAEIAKRKKNT